MVLRSLKGFLSLLNPEPKMLTILKPKRTYGAHALMNSGNLAVYKGKAALITAVAKDKIEIRTQEGKTLSVRMKDLELLHTGQISSLNFQPPSQPEWQELAELADENGFSFSEFTELA